MAVPYTQPHRVAGAPQREQQRDLPYPSCMPRKALLDMPERRVHLAAFPTQTQLFRDALVTATILTVGPARQEEQPLVIQSLSLGADTVRVDSSRTVHRGDASPESFGPLLWPRPTGTSRPPGTLSSIARVRRGVATGANSFFFLTDDAQATLPSAALKPALCHTRHVRGLILDRSAHDAIGREGERRWLLCVGENGLTKSSRVRALIRQGEEEGIHQRTLTSCRDPWYRVENVSPPDLILGSMSKSVLRVVVNSIGAIPSNALYGIYLYDRNLAKPLATWLNGGEGQRALCAMARHYGGGLFKLEPKDLTRVRIPTIDRLLRQYQGRSSLTQGSNGAA